MPPWADILTVIRRFLLHPLFLERQKESEAAIVSFTGARTFLYLDNARFSRPGEAEENALDMDKSPSRVDYTSV